jgi:hypothetical protein
MAAISARGQHRPPRFRSHEWHPCPVCCEALQARRRAHEPCQEALDLGTRCAVCWSVRIVKIPARECPPLCTPCAALMKRHAVPWAAAHDGNAVALLRELLICANAPFMLLAAADWPRAYARMARCGVKAAVGLADAHDLWLTLSVEERAYARALPESAFDDVLADVAELAQVSAGRSASATSRAEPSSNPSR